MIGPKARRSDRKCTFPRLFGRAIDEGYRIAKIMAALAVLACAALSTADILSTWLFHRALLGVVELLRMLLVVIVFLGLGSAVRSGDHIAVDLFRNMLPPVVRRVGDVISAVVSLLVYLLIAYAGIYALHRSLAIGEFTNGPVPFPLFPVRTALTAGAWLAAIASALGVAASVAALLSRRRGRGG